MILTGLEVSGFGRFDRAHTLMGLGPGLNVLAGPNEMGKSTLLRALRAGFVEKHTATRKDLLELATQGAKMPMRVVARFSSDGSEWELVKQFWKQNKSELSRDGRLTAKGTEADEAIWERLGLKTLHSPLIDPAALATLWVAQGESHRGPPLSDHLRGDLMAAIQRQVGEIGGGDAARAVLRELSAALGRNETDTGRPKKGGPLEEALSDVERLSNDLDGLAAEIAALDPVRAELADARTRKALLDDPAEQAALTDQVSQTRALLVQAQAAAGDIARLAAGAEAAASRRDLAARDLDLAQARLSALEQRERERLDAARALGDVRAALETAEAVAVGADARAVNARKIVELAQAALRHAEALETLIRAREAVAGAQARLEKAEAAGARLDEARARHAGGAVALAALPELEDASLKLAQARARLEASSARFAIRHLGDDPLPVELDGTELPDGLEATALASPHRIVVANRVEIVLEPPVGGRDAAAAVEAAQAAQAAILARCGLASPAEVQAAAQVARAAAAEIKALEATGAGEGRAAAAVALDGAQRALSLAEAAIGTAFQEATSIAPPDFVRVRAELDHARRMADEAGQDAATAAAQLGSARRDHEAGLARLELARTRLEEELTGGDAQVRATALETARAGLAQAVAAAETASEALNAARASVVGAGDPAVLEARLERQQGALARLSTDRAEAAAVVVRLEARLAAAGDLGREETLARTCEQLELARGRLARIQEDQACDRLLRQLIQEGLAASELRLTAPLRAAVQPYLDLLFPGAGVDVDEKLEVKGLVRSASEPFGQLSMGTQEQVAVLVRLALADLLDSPAGPLPVILDDALTFTDAARLQPMFDALHAAARTRQIIVLTCHEALARALGGNRLVLQRSVVV